MSGCEEASLVMLPCSLLDLLSNVLVLDSVLPYLSLSAIFALSQTSHSFRGLLFKDPRVFRYLDLTRCRGAFIPPTLTRIDSGGHSWRAERMDENLTEDEFYSGPLRGVLAKLSRLRVLQAVQTLVLDEMASVTHDLIAEIVTGDRFNVRILSIRRCTNVNQSKLQQLLSYVCRPSRAEGTPRLQGLYIFTDPAAQRQRALREINPLTGVTLADGAQLGVIPTDKAQALQLDGDEWYAPVGKVIQHGHAQRSSWEETMQACQGIIAFDAVLCTEMHSDMAACLHDASKDYLTQHKPGIAPIATMALGPDGCAGCGRAPEGAPVWGESNIMRFPLLHPPPFSGTLADAVRPPLRRAANGGSAQQRLVVSCTWCLVNRHCDSCHRWWCGDCYNPKNTKKLKHLEALSSLGLNITPSRSDLDGVGSNASGDSIKVFNGLCVENCLVGEMMAGAGSSGMWA